MIGQRYCLSPFSKEVGDIMEDPIKLAFVKALLEKRKTINELSIEHQSKMFEILQKELYHLVDIVGCIIINSNPYRKKGTPPVKSIFEKKESSNTIQIGNQTIIIEPNF